jgi:hypothetical protein
LGYCSVRSSARTSNGFMGAVDAGVEGRGYRGDLGRSSGVRTDCGWAGSGGSTDAAGQDDREISSGRLETETVKAVELQQIRHGVGGHDAVSASSRTH